ncbi:MAG: DUF484 family protein [Methylococcales bacterium]|nr:DUF484 family protein [Methylococcales bacterium]
MSEKVESPAKKPRAPRVVKPKEVVEKVVKPKAIKVTPKKTNEITAMQVADYLQTHTDFFHSHVELLEKLSIPHATGGAVSLISKQLELFRSRYQDMENQLTELIDIARDNDTAVNRMHKLNLALHDAMTLEEAVTNLNIVLTEYFLTDFVAIRLIQTTPDSNLDGLFIAPDSKDLKPFENEFRSGVPSCGKPTPSQARVLFGFQANDIKSCAIVPMLFTGLEGILAIGSRDENRFHASMGHLFLIQMSEVIATRLITLLQQAK